jgi:hypothetical protein
VVEPSVRSIHCAAAAAAAVAPSLRRAEAAKRPGKRQAPDVHGAMGGVLAARRSRGVSFGSGVPREKFAIMTL